MASNPPESTFRLGKVTVTVWCSETQTEKGTRKFRTVQLEQRYKDGNDCKSSNRFTLEQLLRLRVCMDKAISQVSDEEMSG